MFITRTDDYAITHLPEDQRTVIEEIFFGLGATIVPFQGFVDEMDDKKITSTLHVDFTDFYNGCTFYQLSFDNILDNGGSANGSGNCYTIFTPFCGPDRDTSDYYTSEYQYPEDETYEYGFVYVDIHCDLPHANDPIRMKYTQNEDYVAESPEC